MGVDNGSGMRRAVFLDRDGVLNRNVWNSAVEAYESPLTPEQFELLPKVVPALKLLRDAGYLLFLVSQPAKPCQGQGRYGSAGGDSQEV